MTSRAEPAAASALLAGLLGADGELVEVARTRLSVHYETGRADVPVLCVCDPRAVRLPSSILTHRLPAAPLSVRDGALVSEGLTWRVGRWWLPPRPCGLVAPLEVPRLPGVDVPDVLRPGDLLGAGPGLTPDGDDVLAGALVAAHAVADRRLPGWRSDTRRSLTPGRTTAVSRGLLSHALEGWCTPELADFVTAVCAGEPSSAAPALLAVGHSSGASLAAGALHVLGTSYAARGAA